MGTTTRRNADYKMTYNNEPTTYIVTSWDIIIDSREIGLNIKNTSQIKNSLEKYRKDILTCIHQQLFLQN